MSDQDAPQPVSTVSLGKYLSAIRADRKLSLRQVEEATNKEISNAYLSQIENDKIRQPSPHILLTLADLYLVEYIKLMELAGYLRQQAPRRGAERHGRAATFADMTLSDEEESELLRYLKFMRSENPTR